MLVVVSQKMLEKVSRGLRIAVTSQDILAIILAKEMVTAANATLEKADSAMEQHH